MQELKRTSARNQVAAHESVEEGFWRRQFSGDATPSSQLCFDVLLGIFLPVLCFLFDPIVFTQGLIGIPLPVDLPKYRFAVYLFSACLMVLLTLWLAWGRKMGALGGSIAGILMSGAAVSFVIGVIILPLSLVGLIYIVGILGFTPFFTAFVYLRNGIRALRAAKSSPRRYSPTASLVLAALLAVGVPALAQLKIHRMAERSLNEILFSNGSSTESAVQRLKLVGWAVNLDQLVSAYSMEKDETRKARLAGAYKEITGTEIETRLNMWPD